MSNAERRNCRILVIDDNRSVHDDLRKILGPSELFSAAMAETEAVLFGDVPAPVVREEFRVDCASQGKEGLGMVQQALAAGDPYAMAFVDVRMPPGWDGIETTAEIWKVDPELQVVICTAYSDYSFEDMLAKLGKSDRLVILKKPFDNVEALQLANALTEKWRLSRESRMQTRSLEALVQNRTRELQESEQRFRLIAEKTADLIGILSAEGQFLYSSPSYQRLLAYPLEVLQSRSIFEWMHPDHVAGFKRALDRALQHDETQTIEYQLRHRDGAWLSLEAHVARFETETGAGDAVLVVSRDITERKRAEARLRHSEASLRSAQQVGHVGSWELDLGGLNLEWSEETYRIFGVDPAVFQPTREQFYNLVHPEDRARVQQLSLNAAASGEAYRVEHRIRRPDGTERIVLEQADLIRDANGRPLRMIGTVHDVTDVKKLEERFRQAQKMEAIGQLAGGVAHDFNNILEVIRLNADLALMRGSSLSSEITEGLKQITAASEHAANLTRQLLAFSRKQVMQPQALNLNDVIGHLTKMLNRIIGEDIQLQCTYAPRLPFVCADPGMIEQVLVNLVVNARDAMPTGGRLLITTEKCTVDSAYASSHPEARAGDFVWFTVTDTGTGIAPEHVKHLFEPFFTTKAVGKGTGLGLATVYGIVKQHQGWVEVASELGVGSTFKIFLPATEPQEAAAPAPSAPPEYRGHETILLVEDDPDVRNITRRVLERHGYEVHVAGSAPEALEIWERESAEIDLLLTDIIMPDGMSGRELVDRLRVDRPDIKVILISGYGSDIVGTDGDFLRRSKCLFLQKPCSSETLCRTIRECLEGTEPARS